ncbi:MAG: serine/threonine protein kinase [Naasia sp.]|nr:serine/threonine protein kinase [Naasia sp.]
MTEARTAPEAIVLGGRYRLDGELGRGGMAVVHRAHDLVLGRDVAVKVFRPDVQAAGDPRRVTAEMRLLASVNSPALVTLHDAASGDDGSPAYLVMELVDGPDLGKVQDLTTAEAVEVARQVALGLAHVHSRGIVHRDVKPANVLIRRDGVRIEAKLADLGIARLVDGTRMTAVGTIIGTAAYLSPEQVNGEPPTPGSDVYSLGLLLLETLTGEPCYRGTRAESLTARTVRSPRLPEGLTPDDADLLAGMTAVDPALRPGAAAVADRLARWASPGPFRVASPEPSGEATADLAPTRAGPTPTRTLPLPDAGTEPGDASPPTAADVTATGPLPAPTAAVAVDEDSVERPRRGRGVLLTAGVLTLAAALAAAAFLAPSATPEEPVPSPTYPVLEGELGESLDELQESVNP